MHPGGGGEGTRLGRRDGGAVSPIFGVDGDRRRLRHRPMLVPGCLGTTGNGCERAAPAISGGRQSRASFRATGYPRVTRGAETPHGISANSLISLVGAKGFEPSTLWSQTRHATLRHIRCLSPCRFSPPSNFDLVRPRFTCVDHSSYRADLSGPRPEVPRHSVRAAMPCHRHRFLQRHVLAPRLGDKPRSQRVRRKILPHTRERTPRLHDVPHRRPREPVGAEFSVLEDAPEEGPRGDATRLEPGLERHGGRPDHRLHVFRSDLPVVIRLRARQGVQIGAFIPAVQVLEDRFGVDLISVQKVTHRPTSIGAGSEVLALASACHCTTFCYPSNSPAKRIVQRPNSATGPCFACTL